MGLSASQRLWLYDALGRLIETDVPLATALNQLPTHGHRQVVAQTLAKRIRAGDSLSEALARGQWVPRVEQYVIQASEKSGDLPQSFNSLTSMIKIQQRFLHSLLLYLAYPMFLMHFAILGLPAATIVKDGWSAYWPQAFGPLSIIYCVGGVAWCSWRLIRAQPTLYRWWLRMVGMVPGLGHMVQGYAVYTWMLPLSILVRSGVEILRALPLAAQGTSHPDLGDASQRIAQRIKRGNSFKEAVWTERIISPVTRELIAVGEQSGTLADALGKAAEHLRVQNESAMKVLGIVLPVVTYLGVMVYIAVRVVAMFSEYYNTMFDGLGI